MKVVINGCHGGYGLSEACVREWARRKGIGMWVEPSKTHPDILPPTYWIVPPERRPPDLSSRWNGLSDDERRANSDAWRTATIDQRRSIERNDATLVAVVEELGAAVCSGSSAKLAIVDIPDDVEWQIGEYDGVERVEEKHRVWGRD